MIDRNGSDTERKVVEILKVLSESSQPLGSIAIARELEHHGVNLGDRAIRYHLKITDAQGYTQSMGGSGRTLTARGHEELRTALAPEQIGFILEKLELLAFQTTFDPAKRTGSLPINTSLIDRERFPAALALMADAFRSGLCVSQLVATAAEGERLGSVIVPRDRVGLATVCSAVVNGVLLKSGVPVESRFGGLLEVRGQQPGRFVAVIEYAGTSLDPSDQYIRSGMTSVSRMAGSGEGKILANFRELPAPSRSLAAERIAALNEAGIGGVYAVGNASEPLCRIPVGLNRVGMVLLGGLNPVAVAVENGIAVDNISESGVIDFERLTSYWDL